MKRFNLLILFLLNIAIFILLNYRHGLMPAPGPFINPYAGFWLNNATQDDLPEVLEFEDLQDSVIVFWDERYVPHIFAKNDHDLYFAQGYVTAHDRLWQMDMQCRAIAGRLSEIIGPSTIASDRFHRRVGLTWAAERTVSEMMKDPRTRLVLEAYADGVNAFIASLSPGHLPLEYKLLSFKPEAWTPLHTALLMKFMAWNLTAFIDEPDFTLIRARYGPQVMRDVYPAASPFGDPIVPRGTNWEFRAPYPDRPDSEYVMPDIMAVAPASARSHEGSNNWVVAGSRTVTGGPMLANDPHLPLTMPSIWYEIQLTAPGVNVYGVSLPGAPTVIIGFNDSLAWGMTNCGTDVMDWYAVKFQDETRAHYGFDGAWRPTEKRIEKIRVRGGATITDTVVFTHHGPVVRSTASERLPVNVPVGAAMRWTAHEPTHELNAMYDLNRARNYEEFLAAVAQYECPGQNIAFACANGDYGIVITGKIPVRWKNQGRYVGDGSNPRFEWHGWIPFAHLPRVKNPARGFVSSANQFPVDEHYPYYLNGSYVSHARSTRINEELAGMSGITPEMFMAMQNDVVSVHARKVLPLLLGLVERTALPMEEMPPYEDLGKWTYDYRADLCAPTVFERWFQELARAIWCDDLPGMRMPVTDITARVVGEPNSPYVDNRETSYRETLRDLAFQSYHATITALTSERGPYGPSWQWGKVAPVSIDHLLRIPALSRTGIVKNGGATTLNVNEPPLGPSWRMVVAFEPEVRAWGIYPGGQSGNPGSCHYDDMIDGWVAGDMMPLVFFNASSPRPSRAWRYTVMTGRTQ